MRHHGFRALAHIDGHHCDSRVAQRAHLQHWLQLCEELALAVKAHDTVIDGEIVCLDGRGRSNFKSLLFRREWPYFYAFDLLTVDGEFLGEWPLRERKRRLPRLIPSVPTRLLYVDHVEGRGKDFSQWPARTTLTASWASSRAAANNGDGTSPTGARSRIPRTRR